MKFENLRPSLASQYEKDAESAATGLIDLPDIWLLHNQLPPYYGSSRQRLSLPEA
jgi:hypothetical protein